MKFDTVIIGGGLSGLICGIRLVQNGQRCAIVSSGQSALHFSSGSFDLLSSLPDGKPVEKPMESIRELVNSNPEHPYAKFGHDQFAELVSGAESFITEIGIPTFGDASKNHYRITPTGMLKPTWLTISDFAISPTPDKLPWKKVAIFSIQGFMDFYPHFISDEFRKLGTQSEIHYFNLPDLEKIRRNPTEMRATNIAKVLDKKENREALIEILNNNSNGSEVIIFPACMGLDNFNLLPELNERIKKPIYLLSTLPPSIIGIRTQQYLKSYFTKLGGVYMLGDSITNADITDNKVSRVYSYNHGDIPFKAYNFVLATGNYFSQGIIATYDKVYEPIFNLDMDYSPDRDDWFDINLFERQNYQQFGVKTDRNFKGMIDGNTLDNLYISGAILSGFNPIKEGSGAGVSILSALHIADEILRR